MMHDVFVVYQGFVGHHVMVFHFRYLYNHARVSRFLCGDFPFGKPDVEELGIRITKHVTLHLFLFAAYYPVIFAFTSFVIHRLTNTWMTSGGVRQFLTLAPGAFWVP